MTHFARIDENNVVVEVLVAEQDFIDSGAVGDPSKWIQTSYNTNEGEHVLGGEPLRKNFASYGMLYDPVLDAFIKPKLFNSWVLNESKGIYEPPIPKPIPQTFTETWEWNEEEITWKKISD